MLGKCEIKKGRNTNERSDCDVRRWGGGQAKETGNLFCLEDA